MSALLDAHTDLEALGKGRYRRRVEEGPFWGVVTAHGGYLMALHLAAMQRELADPLRRPRTFTQQFLGKVPPGDVELRVEVEASTRTISSVRARLFAGQEVVAVASALFSDEKPGPSFVDEEMPVVAAPKGTPERMPLFVAAIHDRFVYHRRFGEDSARVPVEDGGWLCSREPGKWDHRLALVASDAWIPPLVRHPERLFATPSLHHVAHFGAQVGGEGPVDFLVRHRLSSGGEGMTDEDIWLWDDAGHLLMRARQMRTAIDPQRMLNTMEKMA